MALLTEAQVRAAGRSEAQRAGKSAPQLLAEFASTALTHFDIFLSHSRLDSEFVLGVKSILERGGKRVYIDWIDDPKLDRSNVSPATAAQLRIRMRQSEALFYLHSGNATKSRWMPWELGYFDGYSGNVAVLPVVTSETQQTFRGEEYLGLYPYVDITGGRIYIHRSVSDYFSFEAWKTSTDKKRPG